MSESDQFRQYAEEALLWVAQSKTEEEKQLLLGLVLTWTQAAVASDALANPHRSAGGDFNHPGYEVPCREINEYKTFDWSIPQSRTPMNWQHELGHNRSAHEARGRAVRVTDEDGKEVHRAPLSSSTFRTSIIRERGRLWARTRVLSEMVCALAFRRFFLSP